MPSLTRVASATMLPSTSFNLPCSAFLEFLCRCSLQKEVFQLWNFWIVSCCYEATRATFIEPKHIRGSTDIRPRPRCGLWTCGLCKEEEHGCSHPQENLVADMRSLARRSGWQRCRRSQDVVELGIGCNHKSGACRTYHPLLVPNVGFCYLVNCRYIKRTQLECLHSTHRGEKEKRRLWLWNAVWTEGFFGRSKSLNLRWFLEPSRSRTIYIASREQEESWAGRSSWRSRTKSAEMRRRFEEAGLAGTLELRTRSPRTGVWPTGGKRWMWGHGRMG